MIAVLTVAMMLRVTEPSPVARCTIVLPVLPTRTGTFVILSATPDSASDGQYFASISRGIDRSPEHPSLRPRQVFGQVMRVVAAEGEGARSLPRNRRVLVVWWGLGMSCQRAWPVRAVQAARGELFLQLALRDSADWVGGIPTYDGNQSAVLYAPSGPGGSSRGDILRPMSMREFIDLYRALPSAEDRARDPEAALQPLLAWAAANRRRAAKSPAQSMVCTALRETGQRTGSDCVSPPPAR